MQIFVVYKLKTCKIFDEISADKISSQDVIRRLSGDSFVTQRKLRLSTKFPHQEISWIFCILRGGYCKCTQHLRQLYKKYWLSKENFEKFLFYIILLGNKGSPKKLLFIENHFYSLSP